MIGAIYLNYLIKPFEVLILGRGPVVVLPLVPMYVFPFVEVSSCASASGFWTV